MKPTCDKTIGHVEVEWGSRPIKCRRSIGLVVWTDSAGHLHYGCQDHRDALRHRYPPQWTEAEARMAWGDR